jgi:hypothetical protein
MNKSLLLILTTVFTLSGCATQRIYLGGESTKDPEVSKSQAIWLGGIGQTKDIDADAICGELGVQKIETIQSFTDTLLGTISIGFYTPRTVKVYCNKSAEYHIDKRYGKLLLENFEKITTAVTSLQAKMDQMQEHMDELEKNISKDLKKVTRRIKSQRCNCNQISEGGLCKDIEVFNDKSCLSNIPKDTELQLVDPSKIKELKDSTGNDPVEPALSK